MPVIAKVSAITLLDEGKPIFDVDATTVRIEDDAAGPFLAIEQNSEEHGQQAIRLCFDEIQPLYDTMEKLRQEWEPQ